MLSVADRATNYGDGLFETIAIRDHRPRLLGHHLDRLELGTMRLGLKMPDRAELLAQIDSLISAADASPHGCIKLILSRGQSPRGYAIPNDQRETLAIGFWPGSQRPINANIEVDWAPIRLARQSQLAGIKHLNRLEQVLATTNKPSTEQLFLDTTGAVICGRMSNVFLVVGGRLQTPALTHSGVAGVMRAVVLEQAVGMGIEIDVKELFPGDFLNAEEVCLSNSQRGILPVTRLGRRIKSPGPVTISLMDALVRLGIDECAA